MEPWKDWQSVDEQGWYWHWDGDMCNQALPMHILRDTISDKWFASQGQLGFSQFIELKEIGGWFIKMVAPALDKEKAVECGH